MKKLLALILSATTLLTLLAGCNTPSSGEVNVFNWGEYIDESIFADFEAATGIRVNYNTFPTNENLYATLKSSGSGYDVIIPSDYMVSRMIDEDMLEKLDFTAIKNFDDIDPALKNPAYDPTNEYSIPYTWGTVGIIYDGDRVSGDITSWSALFDPVYKGQALMFDNSRDTIGIALKYLGYSYNTTDVAQISEATDLLIQQRNDGIVQSLVMDQIFEKLEVGEAILGPYYAGDYLTMVKTNPALKFCLPDEGSNLFVDAMCIPKGTENKKNAEAFINFMCSTDAGLKNCTSTGYSTPLLSVKDALPDELKNSLVTYPDAEILSRCEAFSNLPEDILALYDNEWLRIKTTH